MRQRSLLRLLRPLLQTKATVDVLVAGPVLGNTQSRWKPLSQLLLRTSFNSEQRLLNTMAPKGSNVNNGTSEGAIPTAVALEPVLKEVSLKE